MPGISTPAASLLGLRTAAALSQERLADSSGVSVRTIRGLESGTIRTPRHATLMALALPLGLRGNDLTSFLRTWHAVDQLPAPLTDFLYQSSVAGELAERMDSQSSRIRDITKNVHSVIDADRRLASVTISRTFESMVDGLDRIVWCQMIDPDAVDLDAVGPVGLLNCRAGRTAAIAESVYAYELMLDIELGRGDMVSISYASDFTGAYRVDHPAVSPETERLTAYDASIAVYVEQIAFTRPCLPAAVWQVGHRSVTDAPPARDLRLSASGVAQVVVERPPPGVHGIRWRWPDA